MSVESLIEDLPQATVSSVESLIVGLSLPPIMDSDLEFIQLLDQEDLDPEFLRRLDQEDLARESELHYDSIAQLARIRTHGPLLPLVPK